MSWLGASQACHVRRSEDMKPRGPFSIAVIFVLISAVLHIVAPLFGGMTPDATGLVAFGIFWLAIAWGLNQGWRWLAYIAFIAALIGGSAAVALYVGWSTVPGWIYLGIIVADWLAAAALFVTLWRPPAEVESKQ